MIRVLIVDDHAIVRSGLRALLKPRYGIQVVGEASNGREALAQARELRPDVVLMDLMMPVLDGQSALVRLRAELPDTRVLILSSFVDQEQVMRVMRSGAAGYLLKDTSPQELVEAIQQVAQGNSALHPAVTQALVQSLNQPEPPRQPAELTEREREVLALLGAGLSNKQIAARLSISETTARFHISAILSKLGCENRTQAALYAVKIGLVPAG